MSVSPKGLLLDAYGKVVYGNLDKYVRDSKDRIDAFLRVSPSMTDFEYGNILGKIIHNSPNYKLETFIPRLFSRPNKHRWMQYLMTRKELAYLASLPESVTVYRGYENPFVGEPRNKRGWSWTVDENVAQWFASRYSFSGIEGTFMHHEGGHYFKGRCKKNNIIAFFGCHGEMEIFINPDCVQVTETLSVPDDFDYHKVFQKRERTIHSEEWLNE